jgi:hypothetical protein
MDPCFLLGIAVIGCNPLAQQYLQPLARIDQRFRALVRSIEISEDHPTGKSYSDGRIRLPAERHDGQAAHEVGHLIGWAHDRRLLKAFEQRWWPHGKARGEPSSDYGARHGAAEDFPETFRRLWRGDRTPRTEWLRRELADWKP